MIMILPLAEGSIKCVIQEVLDHAISSSRNTTTLEPQSLEQQNGYVCRMLAEALQNMRQDVWWKGTNHRITPGRVAYHAVEIADYYCSANLKPLMWSGRNCNWKTARPEDLPCQSDSLGYVDEVKRKVDTRLVSLDEGELLAPATVFATECMTHLDCQLYALRHTQHHIKELNAELKVRAWPRSDWRGWQRFANVLIYGML